MKNRNYTVNITPVTGGHDRKIEVIAINFGEAEAMVAANDEIGNGEFISSIECEFPGEEVAS